ncbi:putative leader peptide [Streptomyces diacarni]|uniref:putative leader peptide n=1 Tax=Streptomyces diacarni TaxID=2800381 RepID=UPI003CCC50D3
MLTDAHKERPSIFQHADSHGDVVHHQGFARPAFGMVSGGAKKHRAAGRPALPPEDDAWARVRVRFHERFGPAGPFDIHPQHSVRTAIAHGESVEFDRLTPQPAPANLGAMPTGTRFVVRRHVDLVRVASALCHPGRA